MNIINGRFSDSLSVTSPADTINRLGSHSALSGAMGADNRHRGVGNDTYVLHNIGDMMRDGVHPWAASVIGLSQAGHATLPERLEQEFVQIAAGNGGHPQRLSGKKSVFLFLRDAVILACLLGSAAVAQADMIVINALRAVPRWGNSQCWVDTGGRLKNTCGTTQLLSFMPEQYLFGKTVTSHVITDAPTAKLKCQHVSLKDWGLSNYWTLGPSNSNTHSSITGTGEVYLAKWLVTSLLYQIDCQVPPGAQVIGALVEWH